MFRAIAAAAITLVFAGQALAQDARPLHPLSSAADIRAGRSQSSSELLLSYRFIDEGGGESRRSIGLGADYAYMVAGRLLTIVDTRVKRMFVVDRGANTFSSESFHSLVSARSMDLDDRVETYQDKLKAAGRFAPPGLEDPFWIETDAGMTSPDLPRPQLGRTPVPNGGMQYRYRNESVARFTPAESDVSEAELKNLFRLIRHAMPIHPDILAAMAESKKVPSVLSYAWPEGDQLVEAQYRLVGLRRVDNVDYPLPEDAVPHIAASGDAAEFIKGLEPVLAAAAAGTHGGGPRTAESYRNAISAEFEAGPNLGTVLTYVEFISNFGPRVVSCPEPPDPAVKCRTIKEVIDRAGERDNRVRPYVTSIFGQARDPDRVVESWGKLNRDGLNNAYVMDIPAANALTLGGPSDVKRARELWTGILNSNAYLGSVYKDIGDHLMREFDPAGAWLFWDMGRALPNNTSASLLDKIAPFEQKLVEDYPDYY